MPPDVPYASHPRLTHQLLQETDLSICTFKVLHGDSSMRATRLFGPPHIYPTQGRLCDLPVSQLSLVAVITIIGDHDQPSTVSPVTVVIPLHLHLGSFVASGSCSLSAQVICEYVSKCVCVCAACTHMCNAHTLQIKLKVSHTQAFTQLPFQSSAQLHGSAPQPSPCCRDLVFPSRTSPTSFSPLSSLH